MAAKRVGIARLKTHLSCYVRGVRRRGDSVEVLDRGVPVARIVPVDALGEIETVVPAARPWAEAEDELFALLEKEDDPGVREAGAGACDDLLRERRRR